MLVPGASDLQLLLEIVDILTDDMVRRTVNRPATISWLRLVNYAVFIIRELFFTFGKLF